MAEQNLRDRFTQVLLDRISSEPYPSLTQMDLFEATVASPEQLADYLEVLIDNVEATRYPSLQMLRRIQRITSQLPA